MPKKAESKETTGNGLEPLVLNAERYAVKIKLIAPMLATVPKDPDVYNTFIASKAPDQDTAEAEVKTVPEPKQPGPGETPLTRAEEKGWTGFHTDEKGLFIYNYMVRGFFKTAMETLMSNKAIPKISAYKKWIDRMVFVSPRKIYFGINEPDGALSRPLRTMTPQGERVTVVKSDYVKAGRTLDFEVKVLANDKKLDWEAIGKCLQYGVYVGLGQWRGSGGYGQFEVVSVKKLKALKVAA